MFSEQQEEKGNQTYQRRECRNSGTEGPSPVVYREEGGTHQVSVLPVHFKELENTRTEGKTQQKGRDGADQTGQSEAEPFNVYERSNGIKSVC